MSATYTYTISTDFLYGVAILPDFQTEIEDSAIVGSVSYISTHGDECRVVFEEAISSGDQDILMSIVQVHDGRPKTYTYADIEYYLDGNAIVYDESSNVSGTFNIMQPLVNRRELFNDVNNPVYVEGFQPILGASGTIVDLQTRVSNVENIHGDTGWHQRQIDKGIFEKPKSLLIYYAWLNPFNYTEHSWNNELVAQDMAKYSIVIIGDGLQDTGHADYANTQIIIPRLKELNNNIQIFGYVTTNQIYNAFVSDVDGWDDLEVDGIFMDEAGYDYGSVATNGREAFNQKVDYVHSLTYSKLCFVNTWNMDHIIGTTNDATYPNTTWNVDTLESTLTYNDWYLLESFTVNTVSFSGNDGYGTVSNWFYRGAKAVTHRYNYGINIAACGVINNDNTDGQDLFDFLYISGLMYGVDAIGSSGEYYGSNSVVDYWDRPDISGIGPTLNYSIDVANDVADSDVYHRYLDFGSLSVDFSTGAQTSVITKHGGDRYSTTPTFDSLHVNGDATVTGTVYAHVYDSCSPLIMKSNGVVVISGSESSGLVNFPRGLAVRGDTISGGGGQQGPPGADGADGLNAPTTFSGLSDTPNNYDDGKFLKSTANGTEWGTPAGGGSSDMAPFFAIDTTGNQSITGTTITIIIDSVVTSHSYYSLSGNEITIQTGGAGTYKINYSVVVDNTDTSGGARGSYTTWLEKNTNTINGSQGRDYIRETAGGSGAVGFATIVLAEGDVIRIRAYTNVGTTTIDTVQNFSSISFLKVG